MTNSQTARLHLRLPATPPAVVTVLPSTRHRSEHTCPLRTSELCSSTLRVSYTSCAFCVNNVQHRGCTKLWSSVSLHVVTFSLFTRFAGISCWHRQDASEPNSVIPQTETQDSTKPGVETHDTTTSKTTATITCKTYSRAN